MIYISPSLFHRCFFITLIYIEVQNVLVSTFFQADVTGSVQTCIHIFILISLLTNIYSKSIVLAYLHNIHVKISEIKDSYLERPNIIFNKLKNEQADSRSRTWNLSNLLHQQQLHNINVTPKNTLIATFVALKKC